MKHRIGDGYRPGSSSVPPRLRLQSAADGGWSTGASPVSEDGRRAAKEGGDGGEAGFPVESEFLSEGNGREVESDGYEEGSEERDDGEEEEEYEENEPEPELEQDAAAPSAEEDRPKLAEGFFEVEAIRKKRVFKGEPQYFIKWRGWPESSNTWEPLEHLQLCPDIVEAFEQSLNSGKKTRKRKRKYTHSKKTLQKSYANSGSKDERRPRVEKRALESRPSYDPSCTSGSKETGGNDNSIDKDNVQKSITIRLEEAAKGDGSPVNSSSKIDSGSTEANRNERRIGAKRRKCGNVQRFKPGPSSSEPSRARNSVLVNGTHDRAQHQTAGNDDPYPTIKFDLSRDNATITRIIKPTGFTTVKTNDVEDVSVTFVAMRSDGTEMMVDNKFLKANYPDVLIDFYEKHLRYSPAS